MTELFCYCFLLSNTLQWELMDEVTLRVYIADSARKTLRQQLLRVFLHPSCVTHREYIQELCSLAFSSGVCKEGLMLLFAFTVTHIWWEACGASFMNKHCFLTAP